MILCRLCSKLNVPNSNSNLQSSCKGNCCNPRMSNLRRTHLDNYRYTSHCSGRNLVHISMPLEPFRFYWISRNRTNTSKAHRESTIFCKSPAYLLKTYFFLPFLLRIYFCLKLKIGAFAKKALHNFSLFLRRQFANPRLNNRAGFINHDERRRSPDVDSIKA